MKTERDAELLGIRDAFRIVGDELDRHIQKEHPDYPVAHDISCELCKTLVERRSELLEELKRV